MPDLAEVLSEAPRCVYCGEFATCRDHYVPHSFRRVWDRRRGPDTRGDTVPSCGDCNALLRNAVFDTIGERAEYLRHAMLGKYGRLLRSAVWRPDEIEEMGPKMRSYIRRRQMQREAVERRMAHCEYVAQVNPSPDEAERL